MGYTTSPVHGIEVPDSSEANDIPEDVGKVVTALEGGSIIRRLTGAAIAALTSPQKPAGLVVYNTTTNKLQISDGTNFADTDATAVAAQATAAAALPKAGGTMTGPIAMGSNKVTGLAAGSAAGDAIRFEQLMVGGQASGTTDANGYFDITHGMGTTPTWAVVTIESSGSPRADFAIVNARSSTVIQIRVYRDGTTPLNTGAVKVNWLAR